MLLAIDSDNSTTAHFDDVVCKSGGVLAIMCDVDHRQSEGVMQPGEFRSQLCAKIGIETREGLVQQQNTRRANDRSRESNTLLLSAGELVRVARRELLDPNKRECFLCSPASLDSRHVHRADYEVEILLNREMRPQRQVLKDESELASVRRYIGATSGRDRGATQHAPARYPAPLVRR